MSLFPASTTAPCNQRRGKQRVGIFPRSEGENAINKRAQYGRTERDGEWTVSSGIHVYLHKYYIIFFFFNFFFLLKISHHTVLRH